MSERNEYQCKLNINHRLLSRVIIDQHYKVKHPDVTDEIIMSLVKCLDGGNFPIEEEKNGFQYFVVEPVLLGNKAYRLVLLICVVDDYLGIINAFRVRSK